MWPRQGDLGTNRWWRCSKHTGWSTEEELSDSVKLNLNCFSSKGLLIIRLNGIGEVAGGWKVCWGGLLWGGAFEKKAQKLCFDIVVWLGWQEMWHTTGGLFEQHWSTFLFFDSSSSFLLRPICHVRHSDHWQVGMSVWHWLVEVRPAV